MDNSYRDVSYASGPRKISSGESNRVVEKRPRGGVKHRKKQKVV